MFGCRTDLERLILCDTWMADGTFKCSLMENVRADFLWNQLESGKTPPLYGNSETRERNENLLAIIKEYKKNELGKFLKRCSNLIHLPE